MALLPLYVDSHKIKLLYFQVSIMSRGTEEKLSAKRDKSHVLFGGTKILQHTPDKVVLFYICFLNLGCNLTVIFKPTNFK